MPVTDGATVSGAGALGAAVNLSLTGITTGHLMYLSIFVSTGTAPALPAGWTNLATAVGSGGAARVCMKAKLSGDTTVACGGGGIVNTGATISSYGGALHSQITAVVQNNAAGTSIDPDPLTFSASSRSLLILTKTTAGTPTWPAGWTVRENDSGTRSCHGAGSPAAGVVDPGAITFGSSANRMVWHIEVRAQSVQVDANITPTGAVTKRATRILTGGATPAGAVLKQPARTISGAVAPAGAVLKRPGHLTAGAVTPTSTLGRAVVHLLGGSVTPAGTVARMTSRALTGTLGSTGVVWKRPGHGLTGSTTPSSTVSRTPAHAVGGAIQPSSTLARAVVHYLTGAVTPSGAVTKLPSRRLTGTIGSAGAVSRTFGRTIEGQITPTGALNALLTKILAGSIASSGTLQRAVFGRRLSGAVTPAGTVGKTQGRTLTGTIGGGTETTVVRRIIIVDE